MNRGRFQLGDTVQLAVLCVNGSLTPTLPTKAPVAIVMGEAGQIAVIRVPITDRYSQTAFFSYPLLLDQRFVAGQYRVVYQYVISTTPYGDQDDFEIVGGGAGDGPGLAAYYYRKPASDYILLATDSGRILRKRNPKL